MAMTSGRVAVRMRMDVITMAMWMLVMLVPGGLRFSTEAAKSDAQVETAKHDQHHRDAEFETEAEPLRDHQSEHNNRAANCQ